MRVKKSKFYGICMLVALISICLTTTVSAEGNYDSQVLSNEVDDIFMIQRNACEAHEVLYNSFEWDETYIYPDDFAGDYIDYDTLHVLVTDEQAIEYYETLLEDYKDCVVYDVVDYSYTTLQNMTEEYAGELAKEYGVTSFGVDVIENKGLVCVWSSDYDEVMDYVSSSSVYGMRNINDMFIIEPRDNYVETHASIVAGSPISLVTGSATLGGSGTYNGATAFVTCGHGLSEGAVVKYGSSSIGTVEVHQYANNEYGDYSIITASTGYSPTASVFTTGGKTSSFGGYLTNPTVGTYLYSYGKASGQAYCEVTRTGITIIDTKDIYNAVFLKGMTETELISGTCTDGDSGGPYRNGDYFCGIFHGASTTTESDGSTTTHTYFTPYKYLYNAGFYIETN